MIDKDKVAELNKDIYAKGRVDREHLLEFLTLIPTNDAQAISREVMAWLKSLHDDQRYNKVFFPQGDIDAIISDLASYGRLRPETVLELKSANNSHELTAS